MTSRNKNKITERELANEVDLKLNYLANKKLSENITVKGNNHGAFSNGEIITKGTRIHDIIKGMLDDSFEIPYTFPTLEITGIGKNIEVGDKVTFTVTPVFNQNDAGPLRRFTLERSVSGGNFAILYDTDHIVNHTEASVAITDSDNILSFRATVWFDEGKVKYQNGEKIEGHVEAGDVSETVTISGNRKCFFGAQKGLRFPVETSKQVRELPNFILLQEGIDNIKIDIPTGTERITLAYPTYIGEIQEIISKKLGYDIKEVFEHSKVRVQGFNGYNDIEYHIYTYIPDASYPSDDVYTFYF